MRKQAKGKENKENKKKRTQGNQKWAKVNELRSGDFLLMIFTAALVIFGIIMVFSASYYYSISQDGTAYSYLRRQIMWVIAGFCAMVFGAAFDYRRYRKFAIPFLILGVILLALIFTPLGHTANNATRWLKVGPITFMPGEFAKLFVIIFTAWFLSEKPALGSGGLFGVGLGKSVQKNLYLPEPQNDFILAIIGEELGFIGIVLVLALYCCFLWRGVHVAINAPDQFGMLLASGIVLMVGIQVILNIAVVTSSMPPTGINLPFISYGGNALLMFMFSAGVLLNISRHAPKNTGVE